VLARQGTRSAYLIWLAVGALVVGGLLTSSVEGLLVTVAGVDLTLLVALLALSLWRMNRLDPEPRTLAAS